MKIVFIVRVTLYKVPGGDSIQVEETAWHLRKAGIEVDIKKADEKIDYSNYNLLHFFNITRPADILKHTRRSAKPFVISTILIDYSDFDKINRRGITGWLLNLFSADGIEYIKTIYRWLAGKDKLVSAAYLWMGQRRSIREILSRTKEVIVQSENEYTDLVKRYGVSPVYSVIQNGVNTDLFKNTGKTIRRESDLVLCVARIEGIKNQYNLIRALNNSGYRLLLIGNAAPNQKNYYRQCRSIAAANISFIDHMQQEQLIQYYSTACVHVLPSWFEVCGLSSLEAAAMGCQVVISDRGYARAYFSNDVFYCNPSQPETILQAVHDAATANPNNSLQKRVLENYSWQKAAEKTISVYKKFIA